jgi:hypothetical protein
MILKTPIAFCYAKRERSEVAVAVGAAKVVRESDDNSTTVLPETRGKTRRYLE